MLKISVVLASFNGEKFILDQIESILNQLGDSDELIIVDNQSTDGTVDIIAQIQDNRVKLICNPVKHKYPIYNINFSFSIGLSISNGDILFLADQDDIWLKNKVQKFLIEFQRSKPLLIYANSILIDGNENILNEGKSYFSIRKPSYSIWRTIYKNGYLGCNIAIHKDLLRKCKIPINPYIGHDIWLALNALYYGRVSIIDDTLLKYRRHDLNTSSSSGVSQLSLYFKIKYRLIIIFNFLKNAFKNSSRR